MYQTALGAFAALHLILLILWTRPAASRTDVSIPTNAITLGAALVFCLLSYVEHERSVKPSCLLTVYIFFTIIFDTARARTLWLREGDDHNEVLALGFSVTVGLKCVILVLEATEKRWTLLPKFQDYPPEAVGSILNRSFFWWINSLLWSGFSRLLFIDDLFALDKHLVSERIHVRMRAAWEKGLWPKIPNFASYKIT